MPDLEDYEHDESAVASCDDVYCEKDHGKALLINFGDDEKEWVPKSQIHDDSEVYKEGHAGRLVITRWIAEQKGWA